MKSEAQTEYNDHYFLLLKSLHYVRKRHWFEVGCRCTITRHGPCKFKSIWVKIQAAREVTVTSTMAAHYPEYNVTGR